MPRLLCVGSGYHACWVCKRVHSHFHLQWDMMDVWRVGSGCHACWVCKHKELRNRYFFSAQWGRYTQRVHSHFHLQWDMMDVWRVGSGCHACWVCKHKELRNRYFFTAQWVATLRESTLILIYSETWWMSDLLWEYIVWSSSYKTEALQCLGCCVWVRKSCLLSVINCGLHGRHDQFGSYQQCSNEQYNQHMERMCIL